MAKNNRTRSLIYLLLLIFLVIAYLPLCSFLFALKNDALTTNFPQKYFFSAALHNGYLPLWNPYVNFGLPLYADPGFAFWNPITWIFGWIGYTVPMLSVEVLFYIWIGGIAAYELGTWLGHTTTVSYCIGVMYMCCGFFIGNLQHINFLTCAAFLPLVLKTYLDLQKRFTLKKLFFCLISLYFLASGGHPAIPIACIYFLFLIQVGVIIFSDFGEKKWQPILRLLKTDFILTCCFLVLTAPLMFSYYEIYPHFTRAVPVIQSTYSDTGFDVGSYLSFLYPFSVTGNSNWLNNDPLMRNGYFSLVGLSCILITVIKKKNSYQKIFLLAGAFMLLLSLGGYIKEFLYSFLPLLDHIRTNGEFRVFGILTFILAGSFILADLMEDVNTQIFNQILIVIAGISLLIVLSHFAYAPLSTIVHNEIHEKSISFFQYIKERLDVLTFFDRLFVNAVVIFILIALYFLLLGRITRRAILLLFIMTDLVVFTWIHLPVTGVQLKSPAAIENYFSGIPQGIPIPRLEPVIENRYHGKSHQDVIGSWSYYSKQPGTPSICDYPSKLNYTIAYFNSSLSDSINKKPFVFVKNQALHHDLVVRSFSPTEINIRVGVESLDSLILLQNNYFRWKASVNGKITDIQRTAITFMSVPLEKGVNEIRFFYDSGKIIIILIFCALSWFVFSLFVYYKSNKHIATRP